MRRLPSVSDLGGAELIEGGQASTRLGIVRAFTFLAFASARMSLVIAILHDKLHHGFHTWPRLLLGAMPSYSS
jgi:hypothetical protein